MWPMLQGAGRRRKCEGSTELMMRVEVLYRDAQHLKRVTSVYSHFFRDTYNEFKKDRETVKNQFGRSWRHIIVIIIITLIILILFEL